MDILGISCFYHDAAAALLRDGDLVAASMEERFTRKKHDNGFPSEAIQFCLKRAGIQGADLDYVVFYEKPMVKVGRILQTSLSTFPRSWDFWREAVTAYVSEKMWIKSLIQHELNISPDKILFCDHHMSHAASAFFTSPFEDAAVLTIDGVGEWTTTTMGYATANWNGQGQNAINLFWEQKFPHSIGLFYSAFTAFLGFTVNSGEYKVMGMAPYGEPKYVDRVKKLITINSDGSFYLNMDYFAYHYSANNSFNSKFTDLFGKPRVHDEDFFTAKSAPHRAGEKEAMERNQYYADIAASVQAVTEEAMLAMANAAYEKTGSKRLVMAGGVALNSVANFKVLAQTPFEDVYIQPAAGDDGGALGAALWAYHLVLNQPRKLVMTNAYYGEEYSEGEIKAFLDAEGIPYECFDNDDQLLDRVVNEILDQRVIGLYQGRFEWGPRALGNRSIIADPRSAEMKDIVNTKIKFREPFRPFAPVVLADRAPEFFDYPKVETDPLARFMLAVSPIFDDKLDVAKATTHEGGTGRLQTIDYETNPRYYELVRRFGEATGVPILMNTSFNLRGEPIVSTPANAWWTFSNSGIDWLMMGPFLVGKKL
ncbi:MAG TPA: carbamoyltransferase [Aggregatilinea sp.]|uniref:carbamoyltransferase family protein n=1 Tax=Aggregatilinea sp. TaxID=2806333 RepID=UPI002BE20B70|nr:carbamoyltransferase [Aggregatilinea sp.]HML21337.1 carbamoyltransferase [Aggregatilinea sp.]